MFYLLSQCHVTFYIPTCIYMQRLPFYILLRSEKSLYTFLFPLSIFVLSYHHNTSLQQCLSRGRERATVSWLWSLRKLSDMMVPTPSSFLSLFSFMHFSLYALSYVHVFDFHTVHVLFTVSFVLAFIRCTTF